MPFAKKTKETQVNEMFVNLRAGPPFMNIESLFVESCFRKDSGKYMEIEINRKYAEWATKFMAPEIKKLLKIK